MKYFSKQKTLPLLLKMDIGKQENDLYMSVFLFESNLRESDGFSQKICDPFQN